MRIIKEVFGRIWALWTIVIFIITLLIFFIPFFAYCYWGKDPDRTNRFIPCSRIWLRSFLVLIGCPLTIRGRNNFAKGENYIVLCNHNSFMDVPISSPSIPGGNKTIAKIELARIPVFSLIYKAGAVLVDRNSEASKKESYLKMKKVLAMGLHMCIYPEGTRNTSASPLKPFQSGAFRLAVDSGKSIIPAVIFNTRKALPPDKTFYVMPTRLYIHFLPPVKVESTEAADVLKKKVFGIMKEHYLNQQQRL